MPTRPLTPQEAEMFQQMGLDPSQITANVPEVPQIAPAQPQGPSALRTGLEHGASSVLPTIAGALAAAGVAGSVPTGGASALLLPVAAAIAAGSATGYVQGELMPDTWKQELAAGAEAHPWAAKGGQLAAMPLGGFNPSKDVLKAGAYGISKMIGAPVTKEGAQAVANVAIGSGLGVAQEAGMQALRGEFDPKAIGESMLIGSIFTKRNALGEMYGFHAPDVRGVSQGRKEFELGTREVVSKEQDQSAAAQKEEVKQKAGAVVQQLIAQPELNFSGVENFQPELKFQGVKEDISPDSIRTPEVQKLTDKIQKQKGTGRVNQFIVDSWADVMRDHGLSLELGEVPAPGPGMKGGKGMIDPETKRVIIDPEKASVTTMPHEVSHYIWKSIPPETKAKLTELADPIIKQKNAERELWNQAHPDDQVRPLDVEEYYASEMGAKAAQRAAAGENVGLRNWWEDTKAYLTTKYGNPEFGDIYRTELVRLMNGNPSVKAQFIGPVRHEDDTSGVPAQKKVYPSRTPEARAAAKAAAKAEREAMLQQYAEQQKKRGEEPAERVQGRSPNTWIDSRIKYKPLAEREDQDAQYAMVGKIVNKTINKLVGPQNMNEQDRQDVVQNVMAELARTGIDRRGTGGPDVERILAAEPDFYRSVTRRTREVMKPLMEAYKQKPKEVSLDQKVGEEGKATLGSVLKEDQIVQVPQAPAGEKYVEPKEPKPKRVQKPKPAPEPEPEPETDYGLSNAEMIERFGAMREGLVGLKNPIKHAKEISGIDAIIEHLRTLPEDAIYNEKAVRSKVRFQDELGDVPLNRTPDTESEYWKVTKEAEKKDKAKSLFQKMHDAVDEAPAEGYRWVNVVNPDGSKEKVMFNDKFYTGLSGGDRASIARYVNGKLSHGIAAKGSKIEEISGTKFQGENEDVFTTKAREIVANPPPGMLSREGTFEGKKFTNYLRNKLNPAEWDILQKAGIEEAFGTKIFTKEYAKNWVEEHLPKVKVVDYEMEPPPSEAKREFDRMTHEWYDNLDTNSQVIVKFNMDYIDGRRGNIHGFELEKLKGENYKQAVKYFELRAQKNADAIGVPKATTAYEDVSPLPPNEPMPEWTKSKSQKNVQRVDVVLSQKEYPEGKGPNGDVYMASKEKPLWHGDIPRGSVHDYDNTLGWAMIQYKTGPNGEKIALIAEAQSRWGQRRRSAFDKYTLTETTSASGEPRWYYRDEQKRGVTSLSSTKEEAKAKLGSLVDKHVPDHPLLKDYNRLIMKAAIEQARKEGATHVMVSDAETAMMTEGHDKTVGVKVATEQEANNLVKLYNGTSVMFKDGEYYAMGKNIPGARPIQEGGMRFNYDNSLPRIAAELTGSEGEQVSIGEHKNAFEDGRNRFDVPGNTISSRYPRQNLIFKNPDGTPKTDVSGKMYPLEGVSKRLESGEKFSLFNKFQGEGEDVQTSTPEFKRWFADSKVVDENGKPLVVYHGTQRGGYTVFNTDNGGAHFGTKEQANNHLDVLAKSREKWKEPVFFDDTTTPWNGTAPNRGENDAIYPVYLKITKPFYVPDKHNPAGWNKTIEAAKELGYDGLAYQNEYEGKGLSYVVWNPEQIKSATGNRGTFDPKNPDIRFQSEDVPVNDRAERILSPFRSTFDRVKKVSPELGEAFDRWETQKDIYEGWGNLAAKDLQKFKRDDVNRVWAAHREAFRTGNDLPAFEGNDAKISKILSNYFYDSIGQERRGIGIEIDGREAGMNEAYVPDMLSAQAVDLLVNKPYTPEGKAAARQWAEYIVEASDGKVGLEEAKDYVQQYTRAMGSSSGNYLSVEYGAIRKAEGYGVPESLREKDATTALLRYSRRAAKDMAMFKELESKPNVAATLELPDRVTGATRKVEGVEGLSKMKEVKDAMKWVTGEFASTQTALGSPRTSAVVRLVNNMIMGTATGLRDTASVPVNMIPYINRFSDLSAALSGVAKFRQNARESIEMGATKPNIDKTQFQDLALSPDKTTDFIRHAASLARWISGREHIENFNRDVTYSIGKELAQANIVGARNGSAKSKQFFEKFGTLVDGDVLTMEGPELEAAIRTMAKNFVDRNQGTYGGRGLPVGMVDSQFAPFLSLQKWSVEKSNVIYKDVVKPFLTGENRVPLLTYTLGSILTGAAIQELNKVLSGKKSQDPEIEEVLAKGRPEDYVAKVVSLMQLGSYAGIMSDIMKAATDAAVYGKTPRNIVSFPTASAAMDLQEKLSFVGEALKQGEDPFEVFGRFALDMMTTNVQIGRMIANHTLKQEDIERSGKYRDMRVYGQLSGDKQQRFPAVNPYVDLESKKFKRTDDITEAAEQVPSIIERALAKSDGNFDKFMSLLKGAKTISYRTMPSLENDPIGFVQYYKYLADSQGQEAADERMIDYVKQNLLNSIKSKLIP